MAVDRFTTAGLAHAAADLATTTTGKPHVMAFRPRSYPSNGRHDAAPFVIVPASAPAN